MNAATPIEVNPEEITWVTGKPVKIRDLPRDVASLYGYGHQGYAQWRKVIPGAYPYTPATCRRADGTWPGCWLDDGTVLVCTGCGLDCT